MTKKPAETIGAVYLQDYRCRFRVWAPEHERVGVRLLKNDRWNGHAVAIMKRSFRTRNLAIFISLSLDMVNSEPIRLRVCNRKECMAHRQS